MTLSLGFWGSRICPAQIILPASFMCLLKPNGCSNISDKRFSEGGTGNVIFLRSVSCKQHNSLASSSRAETHLAGQILVCIVWQVILHDFITGKN